MSCNTFSLSSAPLNVAKKLLYSCIFPDFFNVLKVSFIFVGASRTPVDNLSNSLPRSTACISETLHANCASSSPLGNNFSDVPQDYNIESEERRKMRDAQKSLHISMKPEILKLCKILKLSV